MADWLNHVAIQVARNGTTAHNNVDPATTGTVAVGTAFTPTAGRLLVCVVEGAVTSTTPTGWTLPSGCSAVGSTGLYFFWRVASATSADQISTTHNGSNYPVVFDFYEFPAGSTFNGAVSATGVSNAGGAGPTASGLTGNNWLAAIAGQGNAGTLPNTTTWSSGTKQVDVSAANASATDGYFYSIATLDSSLLTSWSSAATFSVNLATVERLVVAVTVPGGYVPPVYGLGLLGAITASSAGLTLVIPNSTGAIIPAGTLVHIAGCWDNIASVTAPTITCSTIGGTAATINHATAQGSGVTTTAGSGIWHQCIRALTVSDIAIGATICTVTSNQSAVKRAAHAEGFFGASVILRQSPGIGTSTTGSPSTSPTAGTALAGDLVIGSVAFENSAQMTGDADTLAGNWSGIVGTFTTGGGAATNVGTGTQYKVLNTGVGGAQVFNPTLGVADTVACAYTVQPTVPSIPPLVAMAPRQY